MKIRHADREEKIELQMTPMIDIVFQLLVFFIMTFKIILPEGDFNIRMPLAANQTSAMPEETPTLKVRMTANEDGSLKSVSLGERSFGAGPGAFQSVHQQIRETVGDAGGPGTASDQEVEIDADYDLHYEYVIRAIDAVSGYIENGERHALVEKIRFAPPKKP
ncbi:Biopolymer transport protein ExbD/TolR [Pirellulimonas nuda]|uniref:Biopolymer transport protein ExbD/TolR n=1 Tax=Pirellulimonas nuda TaxID=2528009 RepID=A0A518D9V1_9BACT|nr:biopolymer transporter ExbD [Pirellulimonas nuda]QDU88208.1 Biopolymer transport protein ExbD/TolR [Pirellulimonas nuda]